MKYVPQGEQNVTEAVAVNVDGSRNVVKAAIRNNVQRVVGISTDKACQPVNVYGMTKLLMERLFQEADGWSDTSFNITRYGNVVSSSGSVIPLFQRQAKEGQITLTNPSMTRFWLTVNEAVELIVQALREPQGGTVLIPRLRSLSMRDVARAAAAVAVGADKAHDVEYRTIGPRFGEKVHEDMLGVVERQYAEFVDNKLMRMHAVTRGILDDHVQEPYSSGQPDEEMSTDEMENLIREVWPSGADR
jgi:UDP-N-acetylglucosamine 4,6-dehydratase